MNPLDNCVQPPDCKEWRKWLQDNHDQQKEVWLILFKKSSGKQLLTYPDALEEAICFGWIDGLKKTIDEERYTFRFSPRKVKSNWSTQNINTAKKLISLGKMMPAGLVAYHSKIPYPENSLQDKTKELTIPSYIKQTFQTEGKVWKKFEQLSPGYQREYIMWIESAKKEETRLRRLNEAITLLLKNKKLGMK